MGIDKMVTKLIIGAYIFVKEKASVSNGSSFPRTPKYCPGIS